MSYSLIALSVLLVMGCARPSTPDEPIENRQTLIDDGYVPAPTPDPSPQPPPNENGPDAPTPGRQDSPLPPAHSLPWPVKFQDSKHSLGNSLAQYQPYGKGYFHGGSDLRTKAGAEVKTPVAGRIEAGHYSYAVNSDGSMEKFWRPWPASGKDLYFEVAVVTDDGTRYEFHHVNRKNLPTRIIRLIESGGRVESGETVGFVIPWSDGVYHHIHYNVIARNGVRINPEFLSLLLPDRLAPEVQGTYAVLNSGRVVPFGDGSFESPPREFVVASLDRKDDNIYVHPPAWARVRFADGTESGWDFRHSLTRANGTFPPLWDVFAATLQTPEGRTLRTTGGYGTGLSLIRLRVPTATRGEFQIQLGDIRGNTTTMTGAIETNGR